MSFLSDSFGGSGGFWRVLVVFNFIMGLVHESPDARISLTSLRPTHSISKQMYFQKTLLPSKHDQPTTSNIFSLCG